MLKTAVLQGFMWDQLLKLNEMAVGVPLTDSDPIMPNRRLCQQMIATIIETQPLVHSSVQVISPEHC